MKIIHFLSILSTVLTQFACNTAQQMPKKTAANTTIIQNGCPDTQSITIKKEGVLRVKLLSYPSKGYSWALDVDSNRLKAVVFKGRTIKEPAASKKDDAPTHNIFTFNAVQKGEALLRFKYARPFDKPDVKPLETCVFTVIVQ